ncbi:MAG: hypothetical protein JW871_07395 [Endomicrobiales bacterium]|nr:hypothetical protein [Endomicrobiales bacterium]
MDYLEKEHIILKAIKQAYEMRRHDQRYISFELIARSLNKEGLSSKEIRSIINGISIEGMESGRSVIDNIQITENLVKEGGNPDEVVDEIVDIGKDFNKYFKEIKCLIEEKPISRFPTPDGIDWNEVCISFIDEENLKIRVKEMKKKYHYSQIGFKDKRKDLPDFQWETLLGLAKNNGEFSFKMDTGRENSQKRFQELRKRLKLVMGLKDDPFYSYKKNKSYKAKFNITYKGALI